MVRWMQEFFCLPMSATQNFHADLDQAEIEHVKSYDKRQNQQPNQVEGWLWMTANGPGKDDPFDEDRQEFELRFGLYQQLA